MNACEVMSHGHQTVIEAVKDLPKDAWDVPNVCGEWSTKDILAHLASFEEVLVDVFAALLSGGRPTPMLDRFRARHGNFNDDQVAARKGKTAQEVLADYLEAHHEAMRLAGELPEETLRRPGTLPWYGPEYALDDFIV
jgi:uncharacterized protein (TIGR03083 family)